MKVVTKKEVRLAGKGHQPGTELDVDDRLGRTWIELGFAKALVVSKSSAKSGQKRTDKSKGKKKTAKTSKPSEQGTGTGDGGAETIDSQSDNEAGPDLEAMSKKELFQLAKDEGIQTKFNMRHDALVELIGTELAARAEEEKSENEGQSGENDQALLELDLDALSKEALLELAAEEGIDIPDSEMSQTDLAGFVGQVLSERAEEEKSDETDEQSGEGEAAGENEPAAAGEEEAGGESGQTPG